MGIPSLMNNTAKTVF